LLWPISADINVNKMKFIVSNGLKSQTF